MSCQDPDPRRRQRPPAIRRLPAQPSAEELQALRSAPRRAAEKRRRPHLEPRPSCLAAPGETRAVIAGQFLRPGASRVPHMCPTCVRVFDTQTTTKCRFAGTLAKPSDGLEPSTPSLPWKFGSVTRVQTRSLATQSFLQIEANEFSRMRREASRVSFLMCPFCVRASLLTWTTLTCRAPRRSGGRRRSDGARVRKGVTRLKLN